MRNRPGWILTLACVPLSSGPARLCAQDVDKDKAAPKTLKPQVEESIGWYQVFVDASATEPMKPQAVLRRATSRAGSRNADGVFVLWTNKGRPEASVGIYPWYGYITHELVSLSRGAKLEVRQEGRVVWSPKFPGVAYKDLPGAPVPAATSAGRLRQMKVLADRFQVRMTGMEGRPIGPRRPAHARQTALSCRARQVQSPEPDWIESGVFGFVQGTDPEAILLLEAVRQDGRLRWQYAFARATGGGLEARLDKMLVWSVEVLPGETAPLKPQTIISRTVDGT